MTRTASTISTGTTIGGVIHCKAATRFETAVLPPVKKPGVNRASSLQELLLLLLIGLVLLGVALTLPLLRARLVVALRSGLRRFLRATLVWIVHMKSLSVKRLKKISQEYSKQVAMISRVTRRAPVFLFCGQVT